LTPRITIPRFLYGSAYVAPSQTTPLWTRALKPHTVCIDAKESLATSTINIITIILVRLSTSTPYICHRPPELSNHHLTPRGAKPWSPIALAGSSAPTREQPSSTPSGDTRTLGAAATARFRLADALADVSI
jgi:hypothetical protein